MTKCPVNDDAAIRLNLINRMMQVFDADKKRIDHALAVLRYAERIHVSEGGNPLIVSAAAILHDIGIHEAERKYGSSAGLYQEIEGPPIAQNILTESGLAKDDIEHICRIIANHHSAKDIDTTEFRIIWDADWLVNLPDEHPDLRGDKLYNTIAKIFKTGTGRRLAIALFLENL